MTRRRRTPACGGQGWECAARQVVTAPRPIELADGKKGKDHSEDRHVEEAFYFILALSSVVDVLERRKFWAKKWRPALLKLPAPSL